MKLFKNWNGLKKLVLISFSHHFRKKSRYALGLWALGHWLSDRCTKELLACDVDAVHV